MTDPNAIVATWGHDWRSALPVRTPAELAALLAETREVVAALQRATRNGERVGHALHRKSIFESSNAMFEVSHSIPDLLQLGPFMPGSRWPATIRLSSAFPVARDDDVPDQRGLGVRITDGDKRIDLLATTGEAHHARDARAMLASLRAAAVASRGGVVGRIGALITLIRALGVGDALQLVRTVSRAAQAGVSVASLTFYSRAPFELGGFAVRYRFAPAFIVAPAELGRGPNALSSDLEQRLRVASLSWSFDVQGYLDARRTPMDDHRVPWQSPWVPLATLMVRASDPLPSPLEFRASPSWSSPKGAVLEPLGDLNVLRGVAYETSQTGRAAQR
jgi:hypothetical protein